MKYKHLTEPPPPGGESAAGLGNQPHMDHVKLDGVGKQHLETGRNRLLATGVLFAFAYLVISARLVDLSMMESTEGPRNTPIAFSGKTLGSRSDIMDRNGILLATSLPTAALYANPRHILDADRAAARLSLALPGLDRGKIRKKLAADSSFVWLSRNLTPKHHHAVNRLGIPGIYFQRTQRRVYPQGRTAAHALGLTDIDGNGLSGMERYFDQSLRESVSGLELSLDIRVQSILRDSLLRASAEFSAIGAAGLVLDVTSGEVLAMASLPDFDPNRTRQAKGAAHFNRVTKGVYEMGSTFKLFTTAMALDSGTVNLRDGYDASRPIHIARFTISDYHGKNRWLSVPEILVYSSNIGTAKMALDVGTRTQRAYLARLGLLSRPGIELPEVGRPLTPNRWREINTMTISYGHGIAVSPLQLSSAVAAIANGGVLHSPTLLKRKSWHNIPGHRVLSAKTSLEMRRLMRLVVKSGTGRKAEVAGYRIGGKTGTADKPGKNGYSDRRVIASFVAAFPTDAPRYVVLALLDEPKGTKKTHGYATGGWLAAPVVKHVVRRIAPLLGIRPSQLKEAKPRPGDALFLAGGKKRAREWGRQIADH